MPGQKKELSMPIRFFVSGLVCLLMGSVLLAAAFPKGMHLTRLDHGQPSGPAIVKAADTRPRS